MSLLKSRKLWGPNWELNIGDIDTTIAPSIAPYSWAERDLFCDQFGSHEVCHCLVRVSEECDDVSVKNDEWTFSDDVSICSTKESPVQFYRDES